MCKTQTVRQRTERTEIPRYCRLTNRCPGFREFTKLRNSRAVTKTNQSNIAENLYPLAMRDAPTPLLLLDRAGHILFGNAAFEKFSGYKLQEVQQLTLTNILREFVEPQTNHTSDKNGQTNELKEKSLQFDQICQRKQIQCYLRTYQSTEIKICLSINAIEDGSGATYVAWMSPKSVADNHKTESTSSGARQAVKESEEKFRLLVSGVKDYAIFMLDDKGIIASWNEGAQRIKGYTADEIVGQHFSKFYPAKDLKENKPQHELAIALRDGRFEEEGWRLRKDGSQFMAHVLITPIFNESGELKGYAKITRDISEKQGLVADIKELSELKATLSRNLEELKRSNEDLQQFAYVCSHDLQEPLRVISNYSQLLAKRYSNKVLDKNAQEFIDITIDAAKRMQGLISDLLIYSRVESKPREFETVDCNLVLKNVLANLKLSIQETGATIDIKPLPLIKADASQLQQLFQNLISNALKFKADKAPIVSITCQSNKEEHIFAIEDNGIGLDTKYADRIFIMFQRLHAREAYPGSGIGLAICKKIAERHGGQIRVESNINQGTTFYLALPVIEQVA